VTAKNPAGLSVTSGVGVKVEQSYRTVVISPPNPAVNSNSCVQLSAASKDQFGNPMAFQPAFYWSVTGGGTVTNSGLFTAGAGDGTSSVRVVTDRAGHSGGAAQVTVSANSTPPPTVAENAAAAVSSVLNVYDLKVLGATGAGEDKLTYTWAASGFQPAPVSFGPTNGKNAGKACTAKFVAAGTYTLTATIADPTRLAATSSVNVTIEPVVASVSVTPPSVIIVPNAQMQFNAVAVDQFGNMFMPAFTWSVEPASAGKVSPSGLYTAGAAVAAAKVQAAMVGATGAANVGPAPTAQPRGQGQSPGSGKKRR
jgi:hypothetical protein